MSMSDSGTASENEPDCQPTKRRKLDNDNGAGASSLERQRPISPPLLRRVNEVTKSKATHPAQTSYAKPTILPSPFHLTHIRDLPDHLNVDAVKLNDILGDPTIKECWQFNFLIDLDFLMSGFDDDVRSQVKVNVVHGHRDPESRQDLFEAAAKYPNIKLITAYMPDTYGTHHTKMMVLFRKDDTAQIVIHTANIIIRDWRNMSQAVWCSPMLPLLSSPDTERNYTASDTAIGRGARFKQDFLAYIGYYDKSRTGSLTSQLELYDFSSIKAALIASTPCKQRNRADPASKTTRYGWPGLQDILRKIPATPTAGERPVIVAQVSSIATLSSSWVDHLFNILNTSGQAFAKGAVPRVIFPSADEIRRSLDGYSAGGSIHTKIQSKAQQKQVEHLRPRLCYWAGDGDGLKDATETKSVREAGRRRAAPHIKTYVRFKNSDMNEIDWAMVTSANLSTQAWGTLPSKDGQTRVSSYELGVVIWPSLFDEVGPVQKEHTTAEDAQKNIPKHKTIMVPAFKADTPEIEKVTVQHAAKVIGFRMPYDLPLVRYRDDEQPWCATADYTEPDWRGYTWKDYGLVVPGRVASETLLEHVMGAE